MPSTLWPEAFFTLCLRFRRTSGREASPPVVRRQWVERGSGALRLRPVHEAAGGHTSYTHCLSPSLRQTAHYPE